MIQTPRIATVHDISGFGRCSLMVALPVLAAMGNQCCPMPTAYLSAHTACPHPEQMVFLDMAGQMSGTARHWKTLGVQFDAIYSGFLGSAGQIELLGRFISQFRGEHTIVLVDPVMGDHGKPYRTYTPEMCREMGHLAEAADIITPNLTEAAILLGEDYSDIPYTREEAYSWLNRLSLDGKRSVVLTGLRLGPGQVGAGCLDRTSGEVFFPMAKEEDAQFPGTGDLFASVALGALLQGASLAQATGKAVTFVQRCAARTIVLGSPVAEGVQFEPLLGELCAPTQR